MSLLSWHLCSNVRSAMMMMKGNHFSFILLIFFSFFDDGQWDNYASLRKHARSGLFFSSFSFVRARISMSSRGATPGLHHRTGTQGSLHLSIAVPVRPRYGPSADRNYASDSEDHQMTGKDWSFNLVLRENEEIYSIGSPLRSGMLDHSKVRHRIGARRHGTVIQ